MFNLNANKTRCSSNNSWFYFLGCFFKKHINSSAQHLADELIGSYKCKHLQQMWVLPRPPFTAKLSPAIYWHLQLHFWCLTQNNIRSFPLFSIVQLRLDQISTVTFCLRRLHSENSILAEQHRMCSGTVPSVGYQRLSSTQSPIHNHCSQARKLE